MVELLRALAAAAEPPAPGLQPVLDALGLGPADPLADHTDLFLLQLPPYASIYLGAEGMLGGEACDRVAGFWRVLGLDPPDEPDHVTVLLAFYAELADREASAPAERAAAAAHHARQSFFWEHVGSWLPAWLAAIDEIGSPFYRRWGRLLLEAAAREAADLGPPARLSLHLREAPPLADPRQAGAGAFIASLLSPVRSGLILTPRDLKEAAAALDCGVRTTDRRAALTSLLADRPHDALAWLARMAEARARRPLAPAFDRVDEFWRARAAATARLARELSGV
jgi:TorA maturation chaperone TorD